ncbi:MAG: M56 family metallopeptidase [Bacteroidota bacterium]|nr:M56 family metallopeptidase [Bacteroidota bacterium]
MKLARNTASQINNMTTRNDRVIKPTNTIQVNVYQSYPPNKATSIHWGQVIAYLYYVIVLLLLVRIISQIVFAIKLFISSSKTKECNFRIVNLNKQQTHFTFFGWIFINKGICTPESYNQILEHEKIHSQQYHSFDVLLIELLSAVMWFNPFVWMLRKSLKLVHEFLADEGVLRTGVNKLKYQKLLIDQIEESSLVGFSLNFSSSTIKKRMQIMNANQEKKSRNFLWLVIPVGVTLLLSLSLLNAQPSLTFESDRFEKKINLQKLLDKRMKSNQTYAQTLFVHMDKSSFDDGLKMAIEKNSSLYIALYGNVKSENEMIMNSSEFVLYSEDSEQLTKILNSKFEKTNSLVPNNIVWAKFYVPKDNKRPIVLKVGFNQKQLPHNGASPFFSELNTSLCEYYKNSN